MKFGGTSGIAINPKGHLFVLHRGPMPLMEFDPDGNFIRGWGDGCSTGRTACGSIRRQHLGDRRRVPRRLQVQSVGPAGDGAWRKGRAGEMHDFGHLRLFNEPSEAVVGPTGDIYVLQGHGKGPCCVVKFDKDGNFIKTWGKSGKGAGRVRYSAFAGVRRQGLLYIADRSNARIQVFDADGNYVRESSQPGTPCGLFMTPDQQIWLAHGHTGQIMKLDLNGKVLGQIAGGAGQDARQVWRGALHRGQRAGRGIRRRHAELARAEVCEAVPIRTLRAHLVGHETPVRNRRTCASVEALARMISCRSHD